MSEVEQWVNLDRDAKFVSDGISSIERVGEEVHFKCTFKNGELGSFRYKVVAVDSCAGSNDHRGDGVAYTLASPDQLRSLEEAHPNSVRTQIVDVRADRRLVKIYLGGQLVKCHGRTKVGGRVTDPGDLPSERTDYAMRDIESQKAKAHRTAPLATTTSLFPAKRHRAGASTSPVGTNSSSIPASGSARACALRRSKLCLPVIRDR